MQGIEFLNLCTDYAKLYRAGAAESIWANRHMNALSNPVDVDNVVVDALLVDFINFIGARMKVDFALYTKDLTRK